MSNRLCESLSYFPFIHYPSSFVPQWCCGGLPESVVLRSIGDLIVPPWFSPQDYEKVFFKMSSHCHVPHGAQCVTPVASATSFSTSSSNSLSWRLSRRNNERLHPGGRRPNERHRSRAGRSGREGASPGGSETSPGERDKHQTRAWTDKRRDRGASSERGARTEVGEGEERDERGEERERRLRGGGEGAKREELERGAEEREKVPSDALQKANKNLDELRKYSQQLEERWGLCVFVCAHRPWWEMISNTRLHVGNYPVSHAVNTKTHRHTARQIRHRPRRVIIHHTPYLFRLYCLQCHHYLETKKDVPIWFKLRNESRLFGERRCFLNSKHPLSSSLQLVLMGL